MRSELIELLRQNSIQLEKKRRKLKPLALLYGFTVVPIRFLLKVAAVLIVIIGLFFPPIVLWLFLIGAIYIGLIFIPNPKEIYHDYIKEGILPEIFKAVNSNYKYEPFGYNQEDLHSSGFFNKTFFRNNVRITGEDRVKGVIENVEVDFNEISFFREDINWPKSIGVFLLIIFLLPVIIFRLITSEGGDINAGCGGSLFVRDTIQYYRGLFLCADFNKNFEGNVIMMPKSIESKWDRFTDSVFGSSFSKIQIENQLINSKYSIYTTNLQTGFYVLSPNLIEAIAQIIETEKVLPMISFNSGKIYMSIPWNRDYFSVNINKSVEGVEYFTNYIDDIQSFEKIIKHLKLNVKIWSKT
ncbi:uncharacterized protein DUF3137 [Nonlabens xylanidelens]|uniref:Uncharacterized protein DUF3137 n=1 Tax=Nonlabens xylanidelens TaxID=191564 RepID=A0A2S6IGI2_9FLAO|nr:DUF3137 domain-containing protein [Nonlabens xylanidelens]PPK93319.1 uncharacterized protein DUF3137 [Nonlabens xylanidelens]PQJ20862.1 hypothetical protein BST94_05060 [Nonlabens xylanidelens]